MTLRSLLGSAILAGAMLMVSVPATARDQDPATTERNRAFVSAAFDRWAAGGTNFFTEVLSPDVVWKIEGSGPSAGVHHGVEDFTERAVRPFVSRLSEPVRPVSRTVWADGDTVIVRWEGRAVAADGQPYQNDYVWIFRFEGERAAEVTAFLDLAPYDDILRRIPAPDGAAE